MFMTGDGGWASLDKEIAAVLVEHGAAVSLVALVALALNGLLMLAYIDYYQGVLQRRALAVGEA